jgi:hypothetical protein
MTIAAPVVAGAQTTARATPEQQRRHDKIAIMEAALAGSVKAGAQEVAREVQSSTPGAMLFTGQARARGFTLDGYGVFFHVEIPALDLSVMWTAQMIERGALRRAESQPEAQPQATTRQDATGDISAAAEQALRSATADDPGQKWRDAVKRALIDAMLDYSKPMDLQPEEWLTVAARGSDSAFLPGEIYQQTTLLLRVKGSDLADFLANRLTRDEVRLKVEVRQF